MTGFWVNEKYEDGEDGGARTMTTKSARTKTKTKTRTRAAAHKPRVLFVTPECTPWAKAGGLGDVSAGLPAALSTCGLDVRVLLPGYPSVCAAARGARKLADVRPAHGYPAARLLRATLPSGVVALILDCPPLYRRAGGPYQDAQGRDYDDNALRFGLLSHVAARLASDASPLHWRADILHCNDWPTGLAPAYLRLGLPAAAPSVMVVHNLAFQGLFPLHAAAALGLPQRSLDADGVEYWGQMSFLKAGLHYADRIVTVSPTYARQIRTLEHGCGLNGLLDARADDVRGILNGIDAEVWNPATDRYLDAGYDADTLDAKLRNKRALQADVGLAADDGALLLGMVSRLTDQQGIDLVIDALPELLARPLQLVVLGSGDPQLEQALRDGAAKAPQRVAAVIGFDEALAHRIEAGADAFLMPSRFEPCGLNQMYSQRYGTPPIVRATGGLVDTVDDHDDGRGEGGHTGRGGGDAATHARTATAATGFVFHEATAEALVAAVDRALAVFHDPAAWRALCRNGMARDFSWRSSVDAYARLYAEMRETGVFRP